MLPKRRRALPEVSKAVQNCGMSILTNQKVLPYQVFNRFGMHNYLTHLCFYFSIDRYSIDLDFSTRNVDRGPSDVVVRTSSSLVHRIPIVDVFLRLTTLKGQIL